MRNVQYLGIADRAPSRIDTESFNSGMRRQLHLSRRPAGHFVPLDLILARSTVRTVLNCGCSAEGSSVVHVVIRLNKGADLGGLPGGI